MKSLNDEGCFCYFHPDEVFVGVCPSCLYERLIVVAAKRRRLTTTARLRFYKSNINSCKSRINLPKMFALIHRKTKKPLLDLKLDDDDDDDASTNHDDSFISIRFDDNKIVGAWEKKKDCKSVMEHTSQPQWSSITWRKHIGHVFHLIRWRKSNRQVGRSEKVVKGGHPLRNLTG
ncbi:uncharacterized protein [Rutidosis leptorrhynchoides]|uniref:uncharacterized protein n=1 Tax=Rutidosis leptorrhynchoides TaxID=125765 RepID=UPI003A99B55E